MYTYKQIFLNESEIWGAVARRCRAGVGFVAKHYKTTTITPRKQQNKFQKLGNGLPPTVCQP